MRHILHILAILLTTLIYGCIGPIHYGTAIHGNVLTESEQPLQNAEVILYGVKTTTDQYGCFKINQPDGIPFTFAVRANGYESIETNAHPGFYKARIIMHKIKSKNKNQINLVSISEDAYKFATCQ